MPIRVSAIKSSKDDLKSYELQNFNVEINLSATVGSRASGSPSQIYKFYKWLTINFDYKLSKLHFCFDRNLLNFDFVD